MGRATLRRLVFNRTLQKCAVSKISMLACSMQHQQERKWSELPQDLVLMIIQKLVTSAGDAFSAAANLRLTCKPWHAASGQYPAGLACNSAEYLSNLCLAFPLLSSVHVRDSESRSMDLRPLSSCMHLTELDIQQRSSYQGELEFLRQADFGDLPGSLKALLLEDLVPDSNNIRELSHVKHLRVVTNSLSQGPHLRLLHQLPNLEVGFKYIPSSGVIY